MDTGGISHSDILRLLAQCEIQGAPAASPAAIPAEGRHAVIVSDLHLGPGADAEGNIAGTENFFADGSFARMLRHVEEDVAKRGRPGAVLVFNGDMIDFLRITSIPETADEFTTWEHLLADIGLAHHTCAELRNSISDKERGIGLKTHDFKSVWKLHVVVNGHPVFFDALAAWVQHGHDIVIVKGNHDLEWYWPAVRNSLRVALALRLFRRDPSVSLTDHLAGLIPHIRFIQDSCIIDGQVYVEHGDRFDRFALVVGGPTWGASHDELNIPFGSFFNRYLINKLELVYPFMDNVRPRQNILHMLMRDRFFLGLKVLFHYVPFAISMIPKRYAHYLLKPLAGYLLAFGVPALAVLFLWGDRLLPYIVQGDAGPAGVEGPWGLVLHYLGGMLKDAGVLFLGYLFARFVAYAQLAEPDDLATPARTLMAAHSSCRLVTMGHTHNPEQFIENGRWYINSGTWTPVIESSSGALREDRTYSLLYLRRGPGGEFDIHPLQRWNDEAGRIEQQPLINRK